MGNVLATIKRKTSIGLCGIEMLKQFVAQRRPWSPQSDCVELKCKSQQ